MSRGRVLVTGGAGFIGCHTSVALLEAGFDVRVLDALVAPVHAEKVRPPWLPPDVELMVGDVRSKEDVTAALSGVDAVVHLAAYQDYLTDFSNFFDINTVGTAMLYEVAVENRIDLKRIVVASSQATYGEGTYNCAAHGDLIPPLRIDEHLRQGKWEPLCPACGQSMALAETDESRVSPHNQYAVSKYTQELVGFNLGQRYGISTTCMRYSIVQGPWQSFRNAYSGICRIFTMRVLAGKAPIAFEDGGQIRDYVWVGDVARANLLALEDARCSGRALNVGGRERLTVAEYCDAVTRVLGREDISVLTPGLYRFGDTRHVVSSSTALQSLGWQQTLAVSEIIAAYAGWAVGQPEAKDNLDASLERMLALGTVRRVTGA